MKHGFLLIDKPVGCSSHDTVDEVRDVLCERKIGHLGTLDPAASGLLVLAVGKKALKVIEFFNELDKEYVADVTFGAVSTTYDGEGVVETVEPKPGWKQLEQTDIDSVIRDYFLGEVNQVPPAHSAVHVDGERAYKLARQGKLVDMPTRQVSITSCSVERYAYPELSLRVACSSGTYIRSLAHDIGEKLRCGGYLSGLRRTKVGEWSVDFAVPPEQVGWSHVIPLKEVMTRFDRLDLTDEEAEHISHGRSIPHQVKPNVIAWHNELPIAVLTPAKDGSKAAKPRKVL